MSSYPEYMYAVDRSDDYLEHYGIKGMKWGVRKALESGNSRALARQYRKASRKLARLEKRANNGAKYARRAAALGAGAAAAGGLAAAGTTGVGNLVRNVGTGVSNLGARGGSAIERLGGAMTKAGIRGGGRVAAAGGTLRSLARRGGGTLASAGLGVRAWGNNASGLKLDTATSRLQKKNLAAALADFDKKINPAELAAGSPVAKALKAQRDKTEAVYNDLIGKSQKSVSNNTLARVGAGALGLGLAGAAGYNAYRAATTKRAANKAAEFRSAMNQAFKGTQYANGGNGGGKKRRRRR